MDIISRSAAGLPSPSVLSRKTTPWAGITWHHTGGSPTTWKAIHDWQTDGRPEASELVYIGYSYGIGVDGRVTELRGWDYRAAGDHDNSRLQVVFMGNWASKLPPQAALDAAVEFARYAEQRAGKPMPGVAHRDVWSGGSFDTDCPGNALYAWVTTHVTTIGETMADLDYDPRERPRAVGDRAAATLLADVWGQEQSGKSPVDNAPSFRTRQLASIETKLDQLIARPTAVLDVDEQALADALAPLLETGATPAEVAAAVVSQLSARLAE